MAGRALLPDLQPGSKVWFAEEKRPYTVRARNRRFIVCTKPFPPRKTVIYTVIDAEEEIRGPENLIFCNGAETDEQCQEMADRLGKLETEVSHRNNIPLVIVRARPLGETVSGKGEGGK